MAGKPAIVILPGLDGTGRLLTRFSDALSSRYAVSIIAYPPDEPLTYDGLLAYVRPRLPDENYILVGESFSGPLAIRLAMEKPRWLKGLVLGASFARLDIPLKSVLGQLAGFVPARALPLRLVEAFVTNGRASAVDRTVLEQALATVRPDILALRAREALRVDLLTSGALQQPVLYLRAAHDRLIPRSAARHISHIAPKLIVRDIPAPHFLFQAEPERCAQAIFAFDTSQAQI